MSTDDTWLLKIDSFDKFMSKFSSIKHHHHDDDRPSKKSGFEI